MKKIILIFLMITTIVFAEFDKSKKMDFVSGANSSTIKLFDTLTKLSDNTIFFNFHQDVDLDKKAVINIQQATFDELLFVVLRSLGLEAEKVSDTMYLVFTSKKIEYSEQLTKTFFTENIENITKNFKIIAPKSIVIENPEINAITVKATRKELMEMEEFVTQYTEYYKKEGIKKIEEYFKFDFIKIKDIEETLRKAYLFDKFIVDEINNGVLVRYNLEDRQNIDTFIKKLDRKERSVYIEIVILDKLFEEETSLGLNFNKEIPVSIDGIFNPKLLLPQSFDFDKIFTNAEVLSKPKLLIKNKDNGRILVGERVPIVTAKQRSSESDVLVPEVTYQDVGITMQCKPIIHDINNEISLEMNLEISSIGTYLSTEFGNYPSFLTKSANTKVTLKNGEPMVIGGLISEEDRKKTVDIPYIGKIPILGRIFQHKSKTPRKSEIIIFLRPVIVDENLINEKHFNLFEEKAN